MHTAITERHCHPRPIAESTGPKPFDFYTLSRWHGETIALHQHDIRVAIVRYFFPYGPGQTSGLIPRLARRIAAGAPVTIFNGGRHPRLNPVFVSDACDLTCRVLESSRPLIVNCAGPETATVREMSGLIGKAMGTAPRFVASRDTRIGNLVGSMSYAARALRFAPRVGLREGLTQTLGASPPTFLPG